MNDSQHETWGNVIIVLVIAIAVVLLSLFGCQAPQPTEPVQPVCAPCPTWPPPNADCLYCPPGEYCVPCDERALLFGQPGHLLYWCPSMSGCLAFGGPGYMGLSETCLTCWDFDGDCDVDLEDFGRWVP